MEDLKKRVGHALRVARENAGYGNRDTFADAIGVHKNTLGEVERGDNWLSADLAARIGEFLKLPVAAFYPGYVKISAQQELIEILISGRLPDGQVEFFLKMARKSISSQE